MVSHLTDNEKTGVYDPFLRGRFPVGVRTIHALDGARKRQFPCEIWHPAAAQHGGQDLAPATQDAFTVPLRDVPRRQSAIRDAAARPGTYPLIIFSHSSGSGRRQSTFLCTHVASHGYVVAALDHSEIVAPELARKAGESDEQKSQRWEALIASRVPDVRFLLDYLFSGALSDFEAQPDPARVGLVGHSFGGWTVLAATEVDRRVRSVVALAPAGSSTPRPGILPVTLAFNWGRDVPTLLLVAENDVSTPLAGMFEIFDRAPATKRMFVLRRADHMHFMDNVEELHEAVRKMPFPAELAYLQKEMRPITELSSGEQAELFTRALTLCHLDATLKQKADAQGFLAGDLEAELASRGVEAFAHKP